MEHSYRIKVNDSFDYHMEESDLQAVDILSTGANGYHVLENKVPYHVKITESDFNEKRYTVKVNSGVYQVTISDQLDQLIDKMGFATSSSKDIGAIEAPMPGLILDINVRVGQAVNEDDPLVILEAMKMENVITSPRDGVIKNVAVEKGEAVDKKHVLIEFE